MLSRVRQLLPDLHTCFSRGRSGGLVYPSLSEFSTVYCDPHSQRLWHSENIDRTLDGIHQSKILYDPLPRVMEIKTKVNKWNLIKLKSFCTAEEAIRKMKRQPSEWEKIIANETKRINFQNIQAVHTTQ